MKITNPIIADGADPYISYIDNYWCLVQARNGCITLRLSNTSMVDIIENSPKVIWSAENSDFHTDIWAPEIYKIGTKYYIYVSVCKNNNLDYRQIIVLVSDRLDGLYRYMDTIQTNIWSIDGSVININEKLWLIWSGHIDKTSHQGIFIAEMTSPATISESTCISKPEFLWEKQGSDQQFNNLFFEKKNGTHNFINEGPQHLQNNGIHYIIYSASGSWSDQYCLGMLQYVGGDMNNKNNWKKRKQPIFKGNLFAISPGHCSFVLDEKQRNWMWYHTAKYPGAMWDRQINMQQFYWKKDGPFFGSPKETYEY